MDHKSKSHAHEKGHALREELEFKAVARRNKLMAQWIADQVNMADHARADYARDVVMADLDEPGDDDVVRKLMADLAKFKLNLNETDVRKKLAELLPLARQQILDEAK